MIKVQQSPGYVFDNIFIPKEKDTILADTYLKDPIDDSSRLRTSNLKVLAYYTQENDPNPIGFIVEFPFKLYIPRHKNFQVVRMRYANSSLSDSAEIIPENNGTITIIRKPDWFITKDTETLFSTITFAVQTIYAKALDPEQPRYDFADENFIQQISEIIYAEHVKTLLPLQFKNIEEIIYDFPKTETYKTMREKMKELAENKELVQEKIKQIINEDSFSKITCSIPNIPPLYTITPSVMEDQISKSAITIQTDIGNITIPATFTLFFNLLFEIVKNDSNYSSYPSIKYTARNYAEEVLEKKILPLIKIKNLSAG